MKFEDVQRLTDAWQGKQIGVVGDLMLDRYIWGRADRISQEAPIPVVKAGKTTTRPGGAANVLHNLKTLGATPRTYGVLGKDISGNLLRCLLDELNIDTQGLLDDPDRITPEKTRILAGSQQVVRLDNERIEPLYPHTKEQLLAAIQTDLEAGRLDGLIIEDYAKGTLDIGLVETILQLCREHGLPVAMDPHPANPMLVDGLTLITPNRAEAFALAGLYHSEAKSPITEDDALLDVVQRLLDRCLLEQLLITLGGDGMALFRRGEAPLHVPTVAREVFDVSGAGDTVIASYLLALCAGATPEEAAVLANHAAGVVVGKVGTAPVHLEELLNAFKAETGQE